MFEENKETYLQGLKSLIEKVFNHRNTIIINEDESLIKSCYVRHMYKKAPFHIEGKESTADGMITETLINIGNYITVDDDSVVYFVTGNYTDFSDKNNKDILHSHIVQDLVRNGLDKKVLYIRTFHQLIGKSLVQEVTNANLKEEFEREMEEEEEQLRELQEMEYSDLYRESFGLSSLSSFEYNLEDSFVDSEFYEKVCSLFRDINSTYSSFEDFATFYEYDLLEYFNTLILVDIEGAIQKMNEFFVSIGEATVTPSFEGICDIKDWILAKVEALDYSKFDIRLPDELEFGDKIVILDVDKQKSYLILDELQLSPDDGGQDDIDVCIKNAIGSIVARGYIQVTYGYMELDEDGGLGNGCSEGVDYSTLEIEEEIERIASSLESEKAKNELMIDDLRNRFSL